MLFVYFYLCYVELSIYPFLVEFEWPSLIHLLLIIKIIYFCLFKPWRLFQKHKLFSFSLSVDWLSKRMNRSQNSTVAITRLVNCVRFLRIFWFGSIPGRFGFPFSSKGLWFVDTVLRLCPSQLKCRGVGMGSWGEAGWKHGWRVTSQRLL